MTYPPQPGQYGGGPQQGGYGPPQPGGFPQHGGYPHPGGSYGPYGQTPPGGGPKSRTGLFIGLGVGAVVLIVGAVLFTGFVTPGFFLSDGPESVAGKAVDAINAKDVDAAREVSCSQVDSESMAEEIEQAQLSAKLTGSVREESGKAFAPVELTFNGNTVTGEFVLEQKDGHWCVDDFDPTGTPGSSGAPATVPPAPGNSGGASSTGVAFIEDLLTRINASDEAGALSLLCSDSSADDTVRSATTEEVNASISATRAETGSYVSVDLSGTRAGRSASGGVGVIQRNGSWCVSTFWLY